MTAMYVEDGMPPLRDRLAELWTTIVSVEEELAGFESDPFPPPRMHPPASEAEVDAVERRVGCLLPPSYRAFLLLYNGIDNFEYDMPLLSTHELVAGDEGWVEDLADEEPELASFAIAGSDASNAGYLAFDRSSASGGGELEIVHLTLQLAQTRWPSFVLMLENRLERSRQRLAVKRADRAALKD